MTIRSEPTWADREAAVRSYADEGLMVVRRAAPCSERVYPHDDAMRCGSTLVYRYRGAIAGTLNDLREEFGAHWYCAGCAAMVRPVRWLDRLHWRLVVAVAAVLAVWWLA